MNEENPLYFLPLKSPKINKSGRPKNENLIKFSPQPRSLVSQMLKDFKKEIGVNIIDLECGVSAIQNNITGDLEHDISEHISAAESPLETKDNLNITTAPVFKPKKNEKLLYPCNYPGCNYASKVTSNLIKHKRTHTMEKPYLCDLCSFRSNFVNSLKVHKRTHTNEKPYSCKHCPYSCNSSSNLKKHCKHRHCNSE